MSVFERIMQSIVFEIGCIIVGYIVMQFMPHEGGNPLMVAVLLSLTAMVWNFIFNWVFDKCVRGERIDRGPVIRVIHAVLFEGLLLIATIPMIMYFMNMDFMAAFMADIGMTLIILVYTYIFNWVYDHLRIYVVKS